MSGLHMLPLAHAKTPEPLDGEFLEYLAACEHQDHNWTVVADEELRKSAKVKKPPRRAPAKDAKPGMAPP